MSDEQISKTLDDLLQLDEISACMVTRRNGVNVMPSSESFKPGVDRVWDIIEHTTDNVFRMIDHFSMKALKRMKFQLQDYDVFFHTFPDEENVLITVVPAQTPDIGTVEVEIENACRDILKIMEE